MGPAEVSLGIRSEAKNVVLVGCVIRVFCEFVRVPVSIATQIEVALVEAVNNAIAHGCKGRTDAEIRIRARIEDGYLVIELQDPGEPLQTLPGPEMPHPLEESGRGWPLIHAYMDWIEYRSEGGINFLTLSKLLPAKDRG